MSMQRLFAIVVLALGCLFLFPEMLRAQMPNRPGRLTVESTPAGATVTIDGQQMQRLTPFTFVIAPGEHRVSVRGKDEAGKEMSCTTSLYVAAGSAKSIRCTARGWEQPGR
jgi:hypothetical protein